MFKPVRWNTFLTDFLRIQLGFALYGAAIALMIRGNLGTGSWAVFEVAIATLSGLTPGTITIVVGLIVLSGALFLKEQIGWGTLGNILFIGPWLDATLFVLPSVTENLILQLSMLLTAIVMMGLATAIYIGVDAGAGPRDSLMLAIHRTTGWSLRTARASMEIIVVTIGWLLGGPAGVGTIIFALLIGPSVQWSFKLFKVKTHQTVELKVKETKVL